MTYSLRQPDEQGDFAADVLNGLTAARKTLPSKYFYDARGSLLFEEICELPEYYPTRVEVALLKRCARDIAEMAGEGATLVEFGAGALRKVELLLAAMKHPSCYMPVDISGDFLSAQSDAFRLRWPGLCVCPVIADFTTAELPLARPGEHRFGFFPGSTIGNFDPQDACAFLRRTREALDGGGLLVGVDLVKAPSVLHAAYNDAAGITAAFNKNILVRINRELEAAFNPAAFEHYAFYNPRWCRIEMHLVSAIAQTVDVMGQEVVFSDGETIHTENSYKYSIEDFQDLALAAGYNPLRAWVDSQRLFSLHWLAPID